MQSRSGELAMRPLPAVLLDLHEDLATGKLSLRHGRVAKSVDLVNGNPVASASAPRDETLGHFLVSSGTISETEHQQAITRATTLGGTLGEALVGLQILTFEQLIDQLGRQARHKLVQALRWPQGAWRFDEELHAAEGMQLRMLDVVFGGLRETTAAAQHLERLDNMSFELTERGRRLHHELRKMLGERAFAVVSAGAPIGEIERAFGDDRTEARALVDALVMCDAVVAVAAVIGLGTGPVARVGGDGMDEFELSFEDESAHQTRPDVPPADQLEGALAALEEPTARPGEDDDDDAVDGAAAAPTPVAAESSAPATVPAANGEPASGSGPNKAAAAAAVLAAPTPAPRPPAAPAPTAHKEAPTTTPPPAPPPAAPEVGARARQAIAAEQARLRGADHYAVLLVEPDATTDDVEAAYQIKLALFDRTISGTADERDLRDATHVRHAYAAAFATLSNPRERAAFDRSRAGAPSAQAQAAAAAAAAAGPVAPPPPDARPRSSAVSGHADAAFLIAATMVALGSADESMAGLYASHKPSGIRLPASALSPDDWAMLRHKDDTPELGALIELLAPAVHALAPMTLADGELAASQLVADDELLPAFRRLRNRLAAIAGVGEAPIYARPELGRQIHVVAADPPVLVAGDDVLSAPESPELVFRLSRALTFLWPGRAVGASRPGRVLRTVVLAVVREALGTELGKSEPLAQKADAAIAQLAPEAREQARATALRLVSQTGGALNLSAWSRALTRTADRVGMLLCGDVPAAVAGAREVGELAPDLVEFAYGASHVRLRARLGLQA